MFPKYMFSGFSGDIQQRILLKVSYVHDSEEQRNKTQHNKNGSNWMQLGIIIFALTST